MSEVVYESLEMAAEEHKNAGGERGNLQGQDNL
jgi:hypothetical protein